MSTYVLVHGAWHGAWCWDKVTPLLEQQGHQVITFDLPGHGQDKTPIPEVSLQAYADRIGETLTAQAQPVILVGHSMGGLAVTQAAEYWPDQIKTLIYITGFLLRNGEFLLQFAESDVEALVLPNLILAEDQSYATLKEDALQEIFYGDCSPEDVTRAKSLLVPQPLAPFVTPMNTTAENFGRVPRVYIECLRDRAISPAIQKQMYTALPCQKVISMDTSHSPFLSAPEVLVTHLTSI